MDFLNDICVVSVEQAVAVPYCTSRLARSGARVIKIERDSGDFARHYDSAAKEDSSYFAWINQGKESVVLNFKEPEDSQRLHKIISKADVFIQNLAPEALKRAGFGDQTLRDKYPKLITCNLSGYGNAENVKHLKAYDLLVQGESGLLNLTGSEHGPGRVGISICDIGAGMTAYTAILEAIIMRQQTGKGSHIDVSLFDVTAEWMTVPIIHEMYGKGAPKRQGIIHPSIAPYGAYQTNDSIQTIISIQNEKEWVNFCRHILDDEDIAYKEEFATNNKRVENRAQLDSVINHTLSHMDAMTFRLKLTQGNIAFGGINSVEEVINHPAIRFQKIKNSKGDLLRIPAHPIIHLANNDATNQSRNEPVSKAPFIGEHTQAIFNEFLVSN